MADRKLSKSFLLATLTLELEKLERQFKVSDMLEVNEIKALSHKRKIAFGQYMGIYNFRTLVQSLIGE